MIPSATDWQSAPEVHLKFAKVLGCEAKVVRDWLRISCRDIDANWGTPSRVAVDGDARDTYTLSKKGLASVVFRYERGTVRKATFTWTEQSFVAQVSWPGDRASRPPIVGEFLGVPARDVAEEEVDVAMKLCECRNKLLPSGKCTRGSAIIDALGEWIDMDCYRTFKHDCDRWRACQDQEPGVVPTCLPGYALAGHWSRCARKCEPGKTQCEKGATCIQSFGTGPFVCARE